MNTIFYILIGISSLIGSWFIFNKAGNALGHYLVDRDYSLNKVCVFTLADVDELIRPWKDTEKTEPVILVNPDKWKYFK